MKLLARTIAAALLAAAGLALPATGCGVTTSGVSPANQSCQSTPCGNGANIQVCTSTDAAGACSGVDYVVGGQTFNCNSCTDCTQAAQNAAQACLASGDGGITGGGDGGGSTSGNQTCSSAVACGNTGATYQECTTTGAGGQCEQITYRTSDGQTFSCNGCSSCAVAAQQLASYCAGGGSSSSGSSGSSSGSGSGSGSGSSSGSGSGSSSGGIGGTTCSSSSPCGSGGVTYDVCTTTDSSGVCTQISYQTSDGQTFDCNGCSDCSTAATDLGNYCQGLSGGGQQCGSVTCGSAATCCDCSGTPTCFTLVNGTTCQSYGCQ